MKSETPQFNVHLWEGTNKFTKYVFVGHDESNEVKELLTKLEEKEKLSAAEKKTLKNVFSEGWLTDQYSLAKDKNVRVSYVYHQVNVDDNMNIVAKKLLVYLQPHLKTKSVEDLYCWAEVDYVKNTTSDIAFVNNCFKKNARIDIEYFQKCVQNYFGIDGSKVVEGGHSVIDKTMALKLLENVKVDTISEPLLFQYTYNGFFEHISYNPFKASVDGGESSATNVNSLLAMTLGSFKAVDHTIHMITPKSIPKNLHKVYFPFAASSGGVETSYSVLSKFIKQLDTVEKDVYNHELKNTFDVSSYVSFLVLKCNENNLNTKVNLSTAFDNLHASKSSPMIKLRIPSNVYYKFDKGSLPGIPKKILDKWVEVSSVAARTTNVSFLVVKYIINGNSHCTLTIYQNLAYDVKFNLKVEDKLTLFDIESHYAKINSTLKVIRSLYPYNYIPPLVRDSCRVANMVTYNVIGIQNKTVKFDNIKDVVSNKLYPFFNVIPNPDAGILHLQYKKVDNYVKYDNIQAFITLQAGVPKDILVVRLMEAFTMSKEDAEKEYEKWSSQSEVEVVGTDKNAKLKFKPKHDNFVNIKLKVGDIIDSKYIVTGIKDLETQDRIDYLIKVLIDLTNTKQSKTKVDLESFDAQMFQDKTLDKKDNLTIEDIAAVDGLVELTTDFMNDDEETSQEDFDPDFLALEQEFADVEEDKSAGISGDVPPQSTAAIGVPPKAPGNDLYNSKKGKTPGYVLGLLKGADRELFEYEPIDGKKRTDYPSLCGWTDTRQPLVITQAEKEKIEKEFPNAIDNYVQTGSTPELAKKNIYVCPKIWCPKSRVAITYDRYIKSGKKCPYPDIDEEPILFDKPHWGKDQKLALTRPHVVRFLKDTTHPKQYCLPCCYKIAKVEDNKCKTNYGKDLMNAIKHVGNTVTKNKDGEDNADIAISGNEKYIKGETYFPLEVSRLGLLPKELNEVLGGRKCGTRHDGTGLMESGSLCYLRKGINHGTCSFLSCVMNVINEQSSLPSFINSIKDNLSVQTFITLENGKLVRLFINSEFNIHNPNNFKDFVGWFLKQTNYISQYNLYKVKRDLENISVEGKIVFDKSKLPSFKDVMREFMIYNSFIHYLDFISTDSSLRDHRTLLDVVNTENVIINPQKIHFVVLEVNPNTNKVKILCPFNRNINNVVNFKDPFAFILKTNEFYEPLTFTSLKNGELTSKMTFLYEEGDPINGVDVVQNIISYYVNNCGKELNQTKFGESIAIFLESIGFKVKAFVIDFSFNARGLLLKNNLYIPFETKMETYHVMNKSFVYYNDIVDFKCYLTEDEIQSIFKQVRDYSKSTFYEIKKFVEKEEKTVACILKSGTVIPLKLPKNGVLFRSFQNDLEIFIGFEERDPRVELIESLKAETHAFDVFFGEIKSYINNNSDLRAELQFLTDVNNPFNKEFKRKRMMEILKEVSEKIVVKQKNVVDMYCEQGVDNCVDMCAGEESPLKKCLMGVPSEFFKRFSYKIVDLLLLRRNEPFNLQKTFSVKESEVLLDYHDVNNNKIAEVIEFVRNPFKIISDKLDDLTSTLVFKGPVEYKNISKYYIHENTSISDVRVVWRKLLSGFSILTNNYNSSFLYSLFLNINNHITPQRIVTIDLLKSIVKTRIIFDYSSANTENVFFENPNLKFHMKNKGLNVSVKPSVEFILNLVDDIVYHPSFYELEVISKVIGVNVIILGRKTTANPDGFDFMNHASPYYIILDHSFDRVNKLDKFELIAHTSVDKKGRELVVFKKKDLPPQFFQVIQNKKQTFTIEVEENA